MRILDYPLWWVGLLLETALLLRGQRVGLLWRYPLFYSYILFVLLQSALRFVVYHYNFGLYSYTYWTTEFVGVGIGCGVVFEIYRVGLSSYPGTARMARRFLALLFAVALAKALADASSDPRWWAEATTINTERAMRTVQAFAIAALVVVFLIYAIPFSRNLKGILIGYGTFVGASVMWFTFAQAGGERFRDFWSYLNPCSYAIALTVWVVYLWSPQSQSALAPHNVRLEDDYQRVAARTRRRLQDARGYLGKAIDQ